jgi:hypothetical protein
MTIVRVALLSVLVLSGAGCGHSEEEWQALLHRQREIEERCQPGSAPPAPGAQGCTKDLECKGDRVCDLGRCVPPR